MSIKCEFFDERRSEEFFDRTRESKTSIDFFAGPTARFVHKVQWWVGPTPGAIEPHKSVSFQQTRARETNLMISMTWNTVSFAGAVPGLHRARLRVVVVCR